MVSFSSFANSSSTSSTAPLLVKNSPQTYGTSSSPSDPDAEPHFPPDDPSNPRNWPSWRKWSIVIPITLIDLGVSWAASGYSPAEKEMQEVFGVSNRVATLGLSVYVAGLAVGPMSLAPLSEYFGRSPVYIISYGMFLLYLLGTALVQNIWGFMVLRFVSGLCSSVTVANLGGTIADLWEPHETGPAMSIFLWAATCGSPSGYFLFSFVAAKRGLRDVFWTLLLVCGGFWLLMILTIRETRHSMILARKYNTPPRPEDSSLSRTQKIQRAAEDLIQKALTRPFHFLGTETVVQFCALYNGYLYGLSFMFNSAFVIVFGPEGYGFGTIGVGLCFLGLCSGITVGPITNAIFQESYFQSQVRTRGGKNVPEARVRMGIIAGIALPISLLWFAWTSHTSIHWIVPVLASVLWGWSFYTLILMTYTYIEDSYRTYAASALAVIGLVKNTAGAGFPLFGAHLYHIFGNRGATSLLAVFAVLTVPIGFVLKRYGERLRQRSPWAKVHMDDGREDDEQ